jgi:hypothetical protein
MLPQPVATVRVRYGAGGTGSEDGTSWHPDPRPPAADDGERFVVRLRIVEMQVRDLLHAISLDVA